MKRSVLTIIYALTLLTGFLSVDHLFASPNIKVAFIPFNIVAQKADPQINTKLTSMIAEKIQAEGAQVIFLDDISTPGDVTFDSFQKIGIQAGADYVIGGSVFLAGQGISIDTTMVNVFIKDQISNFYTDSDNIENLYSAVVKLSREIVGDIYQKKVISSIEVTGNKRVENDAIVRLITSQAGEVISTTKLSKDLRSIYAMGYFDDVVVTKENIDQGLKINFQVKEKSTVREVEFRNNIVYENEELAEIVHTRTGSIENIHKLNSDLERIRSSYTEKNYHNCTVTYEIIPVGNTQSDIVFIIEEQERVKIKEITFEGNQTFTTKEIKKVMSTEEKGWFSFFTGSGVLNEGEIQNDVIRIESLYKNNGFVDAKVSDPIISIGEKHITIHFEIEEGFQYKISMMAIEGDLIVPKESLVEELLCTQASLYNRENIRKDMLTITDVYANQGYANVNVSPKIKKNSNDRTMNVTYSIKKGDPVYFDRVNISGNTKTKDKVIRREIKIIEQDVYSKEKIQTSFKRLNRLDYFSDIDIQPVKTNDPNKMDLNINIAEKETGSFSIGGGFSSTDGGFIMGSAEERNLFGNGQTLKFEAKLSSENVLYNLSFFEPYIMDTYVSGGGRVYKEEREFDNYDKDAVGLSLNLGYRLFDYTTVGANYKIEDYEIYDVDTVLSSMTPGEFLTSSIRPFIKYDSRDDRFLPTEGGNHMLSVEYAGEFLGGDIDYTKYLADAAIYFPIFWKFTGTLHVEGGYLDDRTNNLVDLDYTRFYLGGMKSIRGFDKNDINGQRAGDTQEIGGEKYIQFNAEITFPINDEYKLVGVVFYDRGDVYRTSEDIDLSDQFSSVGAGIRWNSPVGPLRIEYGWVIDGKDVKDRGDGQFDFSIGASF